MVSLRSITPPEIMRKYLILVVVCTLMGGLYYIYLHYSDTGQFPSLASHGKSFLLAMALTTLGGWIIWQLDTLLDRWLSWRNIFMIRFAVGFLSHVLLCIVCITTGGKYLGATQQEIIKISILVAISIFIYEIFYGWFYSYRYYAHKQVEQLQSERWQLELQFESLKNQISPHYLFNCLNTISSLLYKDSYTAEKFIRRMADTFHYVLSNQKQKLVSLREEVEFLKAYYFLLQVRYEHHLQLEINLPKNVMDTPIPPLTLQLLVENAVKHNHISKEMPMLVYITAKDNTHLVISNTKTATPKPTASFKIGIENIQKRYRFFSDEKVVIRDDDKFMVQLPVLKINSFQKESTLQFI
jgi:two-component system, LytTR family, sensor kinase